MDEPDIRFNEATGQWEIATFVPVSKEALESELLEASEVRDQFQATLNETHEHLDTLKQAVTDTEATLLTIVTDLAEAEEKVAFRRRKLELVSQAIAPDTDVVEVPADEAVVVSPDDAGETPDDDEVVAEGEPDAPADEPTTAVELEIPIRRRATV